MNRMNRSCVLTASLIALAAAGAQAQTVFDDFSSGNDDAWTRVDGPQIVLGIPSTYSVVNGGYRLQGPAYSGLYFLPTLSFRQDVSGADVIVTSDITNFNHSLKQNMCVSARAGISKQGYYRFYEFAMTNRGNRIAANALIGIYRWNNDGSIETVTELIFPSNTLNPSHVYRLEFTLVGADLTGNVFDMTADPTTPFKTVHAVDNSANALTESGWCGVHVEPNDYSPDAHVTDVTFDNFRVGPSVTPLCLADWNTDGVVTSQDFFTFITGFFSDNADFDNNGETTSADFFGFITAFFNGC